MKTTIVIAAIIALAAAAQTKQEQEDFNKPMVFCGRHLAQAVSFYCSIYEITKKSDPGFGYEHQLPWKHDYLDMSRGKRQGIVDECCHQSCTISTLLAYC